MSRGSAISMMYNTSTYMYIHTEDVVYISEHIPQTVVPLVRYSVDWTGSYKYEVSYLYIVGIP